MRRYRLGYATEFRATGLETAGTGETLTGADQRSRSWRDDCRHPNYGGNSNNYCRLIQRTAGYGPVRPVVWEGRSREAPPYPDFHDRHGRAKERKQRRPSNGYGPATTK